MYMKNEVHSHVVWWYKHKGATIKIRVIALVNSETGAIIEFIADKVFPKGYDYDFWSDCMTTRNFPHEVTLYEDWVKEVDRIREGLKRIDIIYGDHNIITVTDKKTGEDVTDSIHEYIGDTKAIDDVIMFMRSPW